jgi:DNA-binding CsgD family transcriptional regulator/tetratricopeptide (TPR) repeat protein
MDASGSTREPLVAREAELEQLLSVVGAVASGPGRLVLLSGEPGIGKTRLAREVLTRARAGGHTVLAGRCFDQQMAVPFFPFTELLAAALAAAPASLKAGARQHWPELAYLVPEFSAENPQRLAGPEAQLRIFRATAGFLHTLAEIAPLVLLLDDLHWADATSLGVLLFLGRHLAATRMLILGTYRDVDVGHQHPLEATLRELVRERLVQEVRVGRMSIEGTAALVRARVGVATIPDDLVMLVHSRAQGNPFFTEELLNAFVEQRVLTAGGGQIALTGVDKLVIPHSVRSVVAERVGRLSAESQQLLRLASVLGQEFDVEVLLAASDQSELQVLDGLDAAVEARIIEEQRGGRERFGFAHALFQQTLYEEIPVHRRRRLHQRVGEAIAGLQNAGPKLSPDLARHFLLGGDAEHAAGFAIQAGDQASSRYAHAEAAHQYQVALDLLVGELRDARRAADVRCRLAGELYDLNRLPEAMAAYDAALASYSSLGDVQGQAFAHWGIAQLHQGRYDMASAATHVEDALGIWPPERQDAEFARLLVDAALISTHGGISAHAVELAERGLSLAEQLGDPGLVARALNGLATARSQAEPSPSAIAPIQERGIALASSAGDWRTLSRLYVSRGATCWLLGQHDQCIEYRRRGIDAAERSGVTERLAFAYWALGMNLEMTGAWAESRAAYRASIALDPQEMFYGVGQARACLAWIEGRHADAFAHLDEFVAGARQRRDFSGLGVALYYLSNLKLQVGQPADAEAPAREAFEVARTSWRGRLALAAGPLAESLAQLGTDDADRTCADLGLLVDQFGLEVARPQLLRARAWLLLRQNAYGKAIEVLESSAAVARSQHAVIDLARSLALLASAGRQSGEHAVVRTADAERLAIVEQIGPEVCWLPWAQGLPRAGRQRVVAGTGAPLSPREREVAALIVMGSSNRQIAEALVISERTVEHHVTSIMARLGLETRGQIAVWAHKHGLRPHPKVHQAQ